MVRLPSPTVLLTKVENMLGHMPPTTTPTPTPAPKSLPDTCHPMPPLRLRARQHGRLWQEFAGVVCDKVADVSRHWHGVKWPNVCSVDPTQD